MKFGCGRQTAELLLGNPKSVATGPSLETGRVTRWPNSDCWTRSNLWESHPMDNERVPQLGDWNIHIPPAQTEVIGRNWRAYHQIQLCTADKLHDWPVVLANQVHVLQAIPMPNKQITGNKVYLDIGTTYSTAWLEMPWGPVAAE